MSLLFMGPYVIAAFIILSYFALPCSFCYMQEDALLAQGVVPYHATSFPFTDPIRLQWLAALAL